MGKILGAGLLSHAPVIMFPEAMRINANGGHDFTLATGLKRLRKEVFDGTQHDTVIVLDTHWTTTTEFVVAAHSKRTGKFTSSEMPMLLSQVPYDFSGDPELARMIENEAKNAGVWAAAVDDPHLPVQYATLNLQAYLSKPGQAWISVSICQTATTEDFLRFGSVISSAVEKSNRRVMVIASGGLSHIFHPLAKLRDHMAGDAKNIVSQGAQTADLQCIARLEKGNHNEVIKNMPEYLKLEPEARFGHYLILAGALGGVQCTIPGERFSEYESGIGTGHIHLWFRPKSEDMKR
ncbi:MAG: catechol 1,2-dioxygenase [Oligoflexales bacterium]